MSTDDKPTIDERYAVAVGSGEIRDVILAAGLAASPYGLDVLRMRSEFDAVRSLIRRGDDAIKKRNIAVERLKAIAKDARQEADQHRIREVEAPDDESALRFAALREKAITKAEQTDLEAQSVSRRAPGEILAERVEVLSRMTTMDPVKRVTLTRAFVAAQQLKLAIEDKAVAWCVGRAIDLYLDSVCHDCDGTGYTTTAYSGGAPKLCRGCGGTGQRRIDAADNKVREVLVTRLLNELSIAESEAVSAVHRAYHRNGGAAGNL